MFCPETFPADPDCPGEGGGSMSLSSGLKLLELPACRRSGMQVTGECNKMAQPRKDLRYFGVLGATAYRI